MSEKIVMLRGPERVRRRPAVIFGGDNRALTALKMLLDIFAQEGAKGYSNLLAVTQYQDGSIEIQSDDRGIYLGSPDSSDDTVWKELFCELYAGPLYKDGVTARCIFEGPSGKKGEYTDSLDICSVQYASEYMDVCVIRDGFKQTLRFEKGYNIGGLRRTPCDELTGTYIHFKLDAEVFSDISLPKQQIADTLQALAIQIPGMKTAFRYETPDGLEETEFYYPNGVADYLQEQNRGRETPSIYSTELTAEGRERYNKSQYTASVKIAICFAKDAGFLKCYHNRKENSCGGTHSDAAIEAIRQQIEWMLDRKITKEDLQKHLQLVLITSAEKTLWVNGARTGIENVLIRDLTQDTIGDEFHYYVKLNKEFLRGLFC